MKYLGIVLASIVSYIAIGQDACNYKLLGVSLKGGPNQNGSIIEYSPQGNPTNLFSFQNPSQGRFPSGVLAIENDSIVYGTTTSGGNQNQGVIYRYDLVLGNYSVLHHFEENTGISTYGGVIMHNGFLYGTTCSGGSNNQGVLFSFDLTSLSYNILENFDGNNNGNRPFSAPIVFNNIIYGTTSYGGSNDGGTIYSYNINNSTFSTLINFNSGTLGETPRAGLTQGTNGLIYGVCSAGGDFDQGTLFEFDPNNTSIAKRLDFSWYQTGAFPKGKLLSATNGNIYGTCSDGGVNGKGLLFKYTPTTNIYQVEFAFDSEGINSYAGLTEINEEVFGNTQYGDQEFGTCFSYHLSSNSNSNQYDHFSNIGYFYNYEFSSFVTGSQYNSNLSICSGDSIFLNGNWETQGGIFTETYTSAGGCDSIIDYYLTIDPSISTTDSVLLDSPSGVWVHGNLINTEGIYDSIFESSNGCDSTSSVVVIDVTSVIHSESEAFLLHPNPTSSISTLSLSNWKNVELQLTVYNSIGESIIIEKITSPNTLINLNQYSTGVYFLQITEGTKSSIIKLIKSK